jgi:pyruvate,water dikinase
MGLAEQMIQGRTIADMFVVSRSEPGVIIEQQLAHGAVSGEAGEPASLSSAEVKVLVEAALKLEKHFAIAQDIEWAIDERGQLVILQARELRLKQAHRQSVRSGKSVLPLASGGTTIFAGHAVGEAWVSARRDLDSFRGAVLIASRPPGACCRVPEDCRSDHSVWESCRPCSDVGP